MWVGIAQSIGVKLKLLFRYAIPAHISLPTTINSSLPDQPSLELDAMNLSSDEEPDPTANLSDGGVGGLPQDPGPSSQGRGTGEIPPRRSLRSSSMELGSPLAGISRLYYNWNNNKVNNRTLTDSRGEEESSEETMGCWEARERQSSKAFQNTIQFF